MPRSSNSLTAAAKLLVEYLHERASGEKRKARL